MNTNPQAPAAQYGESSRALVPPPSPNVYDSTGQAITRLAELSHQADHILNRLRGPQPATAEQSGKNPTEPSIGELSHELHRYIDRMERQFTELTKLIG